MPVVGREWGALAKRLSGQPIASTAARSTSIGMEGRFVNADGEWIFWSEGFQISRSEIWKDGKDILRAEAPPTDAPVEWKPRPEHTLKGARVVHWRKRASANTAGSMSLRSRISDGRLSRVYAPSTRDDADQHGLPHRHRHGHEPKITPVVNRMLLSSPIGGVGVSHGPAQVEMLLVSAAGECATVARRSKK